MNPMDGLRRARRLTDLKIREVSSVDRGAGVGVDVLLMKRDDVEPLDVSDEALDLPERMEKIIRDGGVFDQEALAEAVHEYHEASVAKARADHAEDKARRRRKDKAEAEQRAAAQRQTLKAGDGDHTHGRHDLDCEGRCGGCADDGDEGTVLR
ncbi:MAG: hypothetical protein ACLQF1_07975 [Methyloceanibacter sp.]